MIEVEEHLTLRQAAARLNVGASTLRREIKLRRLRPVRKLGHRTVLIPASTLNRYLLRHTV
jgi:excisionase family DNA binding protein